VGIEHEDGMLEVASVGWISPKSDEEEIQVAQAISAVPEMIDALIGLHELVCHLLKFEDDKNMQNTFEYKRNKIEKALEKAEVDFE
jgi:hypothetical protein